MDEVEVHSVLLLVGPMVLRLALLLLLPQVAAPQSLLAKEEVALTPPYYCGLLPLVAHYCMLAQ